MGWYIFVMGVEDIRCAGFCDRNVGELGIEKQPGLGSCRFLFEILRCVEDLVAIAMVGDKGLLVIRLVGGCLPTIAQTVGQSERGPYAPGILNEKLIHSKPGFR